MTVYRNQAEWRYARCKNCVSENVSSDDGFIEILWNVN